MVTYPKAVIAPDTAVAIGDIHPEFARSRPRPSYEQRFRRALDRLPETARADYNAKEHTRITHLVTLARTQTALHDEGIVVLPNEEDLLQLRRYINAYEGAD